MPCLLIEPGLELDGVVDADTDQHRERTNHDHADRDPDQSHHAEGQDKPHPHHKNRQEPVTDVPEEKTHGQHHEEHGGSDQHSHRLADLLAHLLGKSRRTSHGHLDARRGIRQTDARLDAVEDLVPGILGDAGREGDDTDRHHVGGEVPGEKFRRHLFLCHDDLRFRCGERTPVHLLYHVSDALGSGDVLLTVDLRL